MRGYTPNPAYHPDDKDILDFLHSSKPNAKDLQRFLAGTGIYLSPIQPINDQYEYIARLPLNWSRCETLLSLEKLRPKSESESDGFYETDATIEEAEAALQKVIEHRSSKEKEEYSIKRNSDGSIVATVKYQDINYGRTRVFQKVDLETKLEIKPLNGGFQVSRIDDERSPAIEEAFAGFLEESLKSKSQTLVSQRVLLEGLLTPQSRIDFFMNFMDGLNGYDFLDLINIRVRRFTDETSELPEDSAETEALKSGIKSAMLAGTGLRHAPELKSYFDADFYLHSAEWVCASPTDNEVAEIHCKASFKERAGKFHFSYRVTGISSRIDGVIEVKRRPPEGTHRKIYAMLQDSANDAFIKNSTA